jgi:hypothetical protein
VGQLKLNLKGGISEAFETRRDAEPARNHAPDAQRK